MSRIGKQPVTIPEKVKVALDGRVLRAEGPKGKLEMRLMDNVNVEVSDGQVQCKMVEPIQASSKANFGLTRSLVSNMIKGVSEGFLKELEIHGVGFRANVRGRELDLSLGYSHPLTYKIPDGVEIKVEKQTFVRISGADHQLVGQVAAEIRHYRVPEPYKGKGVKYKEEVVRRKAGKAAAGSTA